MSGHEKAVVGVIGSVVILLFVLLFWPQNAPPPKESSTLPDSTSAPQADNRTSTPPPPRPPPKTHAEPAPPTAAAEPSVPPPDPTNSEEPPPLTGLILTFPRELSEGEIDEELAKCKAEVVRRRGHFVKVVPTRKSSYETIKQCFKYGAVTVQEERGGPPRP